MSASLYVKSLLVNSPFESVAKIAQQLGKLKHRAKYPELGEVLLEDRRLSQVITRLVQPGSNVLDIGCHLGAFISEASKAAPKGSHVAIEASPTKSAWLKRRLPHVRVEQVAISDASGTATFEENIDNPGFSRLQGNHPSPDRVSRYDVNVTTLDAIDFPNKIDLMKIDIEGSELAAFKGGSMFIQKHQPNILFECGVEPIGGTGTHQHPGLNRNALYEHVTGPMKYDVFTFTDFLFGKGPLGADEFRKCGIYPFRAFNFVAMPR